MSIQIEYEQLPAGLHDKKGKLANRVSNWLITMNTNTREDPLDPSAAHLEQLTTATNRLFSDPNRLKDVIIFRNDSGEWTAQYIKHVKATSRLEIGHNKQGARLHAHVALKIRHTAFLHLNIPQIYVKMNEILESLNSDLRIHYINVKAHSPTIDDYLFQ